MNEGIYRSPEWLRKFADFEIRTGKDLKGDQPDKSEPKKEEPKKDNKSEWDKRWREADQDLFIEFYKEVYPRESRDRYRNQIWGSDLEDIRRRYRGDFEIWNQYDLWLKQKRARAREKADREEAERRERLRKEKEQERIKKDLDNLHDRIISDFKSAPYQDKVNTPAINGQVCFEYNFEDGTKLTLNGDKLTYDKLEWTLGIIYRNKFISLANAILESELWKSRHQRTSGQKRTYTSSSNPKSTHPKWGLYQNLKQTVQRREEQLKKMAKNDPERQGLENEYRVAKNTLDKLKNQYQFEHLKTFEEYREGDHQDDVDFIEDLFIEYADKWNMKPGKYISDITTQPKGFNSKHTTLWYTVYESFDPKIARLYVPSDFYIELEITAHAWKGNIDKEGLFSDIDKFLDRVGKYGWKYVESKTNNKKTFLNADRGENYSNKIGYYLYKDE